MTLFSRRCAEVVYIHGAEPKGSVADDPDAEAVTPLHSRRKRIGVVLGLAAITTIVTAGYLAPTLKRSWDLMRNPSGTEAVAAGTPEDIAFEDIACSVTPQDLDVTSAWTMAEELAKRTDDLSTGQIFQGLRVQHDGSIQPETSFGLPPELCVGEIAISGTGEGVTTTNNG